MSISNVRGEQTDRSSTSEPTETSIASGRLWRGLTLVSILVLGIALRVWNLAQNSWGNEYYTAGVRSMMISWHNFLYNSFDPAGFVSVDKPPVALWIQAASAKLFGFHGLSILVPQALEGVAAVWIVYHMLQRRFGALAGLLAALFLAVTPISVAIDRSSNTDSCLVLVLLLAAWALIRAAEEGNRRLLLLSMALIGLGFNVKMLAAFVVLPAFVLVYFLAAPLALRRRITDLAIAAAALAIVSSVWVVVYDLTPPERRPFAGTTKNNSMLELAIGPYAVGRFVRPAALSETPPSYTAPGRTEIATVQPSAGTDSTVQVSSRSAWSRLFVQAPSGPLRLLNGQLAGQVEWLVPLALMGLVLGAFRDRFSRPLAPTHLALLLWFLWAITYGIVYSFAGGIMHLYYLATMAPPLAALAGIGVACLWDRYVQKSWRAILLPMILLLTALWQIYINSSAMGWTLGKMLNAMAAFPDLKNVSGGSLFLLQLALISGTLVAAGGLLLILFCQPWSGTRREALSTVMLGTGVLALLAFPVAWALSSVLVPGHGALPSADMARFLAGGDSVTAHGRGGLVEAIGRSKMVGFLKANRQEERYLLATPSARLASPIIISTGEPVMAMGGFHGLDPILSPEKLDRMVQAKQVRFVMLGALSFISLRLGAESAGRPIAEWVRANGKLVDPTLWRSSRGGRDNLELYDLRPGAGLVPAPLR